MIRYGVIALLWATLTPTLFANNQAVYKIVKKDQRTSSMIKTGKFHALLDQKKDDTTPAHLNYSIEVKFYGEFAGRESMLIPNDYFSQDFLVQLRKTGLFTGENFKVRHMGFADCSDYHGQVYQQCDRLYFYDIETVGRHYYRFPRHSRHAGRVIRINEEIKNPKILAHVKYGLPVIGAVSLDMQGEFMGIKAKIGADLVRQR